MWQTCHGKIDHEGAAITTEKQLSSVSDVGMVSYDNCDNGMDTWPHTWTHDRSWTGHWPMFAGHVQIAPSHHLVTWGHSTGHRGASSGHSYQWSQYTLLSESVCHWLAAQPTTDQYPLRLRWLCRSEAASTPTAATTTQLCVQLAMNQSNHQQSPSHPSAPSLVTPFITINHNLFFSIVNKENCQVNYNKSLWIKMGCIAKMNATKFGG